MDTSHLTPTQLEIQAAIEKICAQFPDSYWAERDDSGAYPHELHAALARDGWIGIALPESEGGAGLGIAEATVMMQAIAQSGAGMAGAQSLHANVYATQPLARFASPAQRADWLPRLISGEWRTCFGVTEPDAGLDTRRLTTAAVRDGDSYLISGQKIWITAAQVAQRMVLLARTGPPVEPPGGTGAAAAAAADSKTDTASKPAPASADGLSLFFIPLDTSSPHLTLQPIKKMGGRAVDANQVFFDGYRVPASSLVGREGQGFRIVLHGMNAERCLLAGEALGLGYAALARASAYAAERVVFGRPIGVNQAVQHPLADAYMRLEAAKLATYHAARLYDASAAVRDGKGGSSGEGAGSASSSASASASSAAPGGAPVDQATVGVAANSAKYLAAEAAFAACERAVLAHGGMGYARDFHVERYLRECFVPRIAPVSREMILSYVAEKSLGLPRSY